MKDLRWNPGKNTKLKLERGVSFEAVEAALEKGAYSIKRIKSPKHPGQKCFIITLYGNRWVVPFSENRNSLFLRTIFRE